MALKPNLSTSTGPAYASPTGQITPMGLTPKFPTQNLSAPANTLPAGYQKNPQGILVNAQGQVYGGGGYTMNNGVVSAPSSNPPAAPAPSLGVGGGAKAPAGMEYGPNGQPQPMQQYSSSNPVTLPALLNQTANTASQPSPQYNAAQGNAASAATGLLNLGGTNPGNSGQAYADYQKAVNDLATFKSGIAKQFGTMETADSGIPIEFVQGREGVLNRQYASQIDALQQAVNAKAAALGYQVSGQQAQTSALQGAGSTANTSAGAATTQQGTQQQGLLGAAGLTQPQLGQYGQTYYNPLTAGQAGGGTGVSPSDPFYQTMQGLAQMLANNQGAAIPSSITSNPVLQNQLIQMTKAINPNFNYNTAQGLGAAQQSNAQVGGTAGVTANQQVFTQANSDYANLKATTSNIDQFSSLLLNTMVDPSGNQINPSDVKYANQTLAAIRGQLSSSQQAVYDNTLASLKSRVSGLLAAGGSEIPSQITSDANKILDGSLPIGSLSAVLGRINQEGQILLATQAQKVNDAYNSIQSGGTSSTGNATTNTNQPNPWH